LTRDALPRWSDTGVDSRRGGFFEKIAMDGRPLEEPRRARVVARQIYVFATAARQGWLPSADAHVEHGLRFLLDRMRTEGGTIAAAVEPDGRVVRGEFDLYEHAFALFALAAARQGRPDRQALAADAEALLRRMREGWAHARAGFEESRPGSEPLKSNPHMHLFEAALAWSEWSGGVWQALADEIAELCLDRFIDPASGALREYFDREWRPMPGSPGRVVEPGHQFEWAWLLMRWGRQRGRPDALAAARRLLEIGEQHGVDATRQVAINELRDDFEIVDATAKLWPQTERLKAWCAAAEGARDEAERAVAGARIVDAAQGLARYFEPAAPGLWHEQLTPDGRFVDEPCRASSLYHIVCAIDTLHGVSPEALAR
jgi:mannose-6-phosphate isomerase